MREHNRDSAIVESSNLINAEFKTLVIKMLNELRENLNKEIKYIKTEMEIIKGNQSGRKNTLSEVKSISEEMNRVDEAED